MALRKRLSTDNSTEQEQSDEQVKHSVWELARTPNSEGMWQKDDLFNVLYWLRQVIGLMCGILFGLIPLQGFAGNLGFLAGCSFVCYVYYARFLQIDEEEYGRWELVSEGLMNAYALFLVSSLACGFSLYLITL